MIEIVRAVVKGDYAIWFFDSRGELLSIEILETWIENAVKYGGYNQETLRKLCKDNKEFLI